MKMLELYCGNKTISKAFQKDGWETYNVDWDPAFEPTKVMDISGITWEDIEQICNGKPDVIWASPDCTTYSVAGGSLHRYGKDFTYMPKNDYGKFCDKANYNLAKLLDSFDGIYFIENPRGFMRLKDFWHCPMYSITYCQYGDYRQKPTDIWTNHPNPDFLPPCKRGASCHTTSPSHTLKCYTGKDKMERAEIPKQLADHIVEICDRYYEDLLTGVYNDRLY